MPSLIAKSKNLKSYRNLVFVCLALISLAPTLSAVSGQAVPTINSVRWYPYPPTPNDSVSIRANVTSPVGIRNVTIYYRFGEIGLSLHSSSDYNNSFMLGPFLGNTTNGLWSHSFPRQSNGTIIYFVIAAFDNDGINSTYPDFRPFSQPQSILIEFPPKAYMSNILIDINTLTLSDVIQQANVSIEMGGYLPSVAEPSSISISIDSNGPYHQQWFPYFSLLETDSRFFYRGRSSSLMDLSGSTNQLPYDTYTLSFNITIPYKFDNLTYALSSRAYVFPSNSIYNVWQVPQPTIISYGFGNVTRLTVSTTFSRRIAIFYPPLVLMMIALALLGLVPLVSVYHPEKRYDLFLNIIILGSSAELSQSIYPPTGFLGDNIFLESFAFILIATVFMMSISSLPEKIRSKAFRGFHLEFFTTIGTVAFVTLFISTTNFPILAKWIVPFAGSSGVIITVFYMYAPYWLPIFRKLVSRRPKKLVRNHAGRSS